MLGDYEKFYMLLESVERTSSLTIADRCVISSMCGAATIVAL